MRDSELSDRASVIVGEACDVDMVQISGTARANCRWNLERDKWCIAIDPMKVAGQLNYLWLHEVGHIVCGHVATKADHIAGRGLPGDGSSKPERYHRIELEACEWVAKNAHKHMGADALPTARTATAHLCNHAAQLMGLKAVTMRQQLAELSERLTALEKQFQPRPQRRVRTW